MPERRLIGFVWDNLGPSHHDRLRAVHHCTAPVVAVELRSRSATYDWEREEKPVYPVVTLMREKETLGTLRLTWRVVRALRRSGARDIFFCHYANLSIFFAAVVLRTLGCRVYTMLDSKFDDYPRKWRTTVAKVLAMTPYYGALVASKRSKDYVTYLGIKPDRIEEGYNTLDLECLRNLGECNKAPPFAERPFLVVARLIALKNLTSVVSAFARYRLEGGSRRLIFVGSGPQKDELQRLAEALGVAKEIDFKGARRRAQVAREMGNALVLMLPSLQETYGLVVVEAMAMGLPVIVSRQAGSTDKLVANLVNGFVINPADIDQLISAMQMLDRDEALYSRMASEALKASEQGDSRHFAAAVERLTSRRGN